MARGIIAGLGALLAVLAVMGIFVRAFENRMIFYPVKYPSGDWRPLDSGLPAEDVRFASGDGVRLHGWFARAKGREASLTLLWFHGNAGNITHRTDNMKELIKLGIDVFIFDYRGYGRSEGSPSEEGLYRDGFAAYDYLRQGRGIDAESIVLFGRSLGAAVALEVGTSRPVRGIILESAFTSAGDMARILMPLFPARYLLRSRFDNIGKIGTVTVPLLIIHGANDEIVPLELGRKLFEAAPESKTFYTIPGSGHNDTHIVGRDAYYSVLKKFWEGL